MNTCVCTVPENGSVMAIMYLVFLHPNNSASQMAITLREFTFYEKNLIFLKLEVRYELL
jgi:hypothetical protein